MLSLTSLALYSSILKNKQREGGDVSDDYDDSNGREKRN